ncbi:hypothetical protein MACJ_003867 [Theileria orientalis]|uniref:Uncharacterized protein n=1 Tax=Theileria orientalis TaxID=68886 RepID=A0A976SKQ1_THEOR|nr:hypothetical protein MACJ_003867 [Theileria orientalis]
MIKHNVKQKNDSKVYLTPGLVSREFPHSRPCREMQREIYSKYFCVETKYHIK